MEGWSTDFSKLMEVMVKEIEDFVAEVTKDVNDMVDAFVNATEEVAEQMQIAFETEIEPRLNEFIDPILEAYLGFEVMVEDTTQPVISTVEPLLNDHPACVGCRHYHGQSYGGTMLVCGMHPYGWEGEKCPDWESFWKD
jgi:hypothetical protein